MITNQMDVPIVDKLGHRLGEIPCLFDKLVQAAFGSLNFADSLKRPHCCPRPRHLCFAEQVLVRVEQFQIPLHL